MKNLLVLVILLTGCVSKQRQANYLEQVAVYRERQAEVMGMAQAMGAACESDLCRFVVVQAAADGARIGVPQAPPDPTEMFWRNFWSGLPILAGYYFQNEAIESQSSAIVDIVRAVQSGGNGTAALQVGGDYITAPIDNSQTIDQSVTDNSQTDNSSEDQTIGDIGRWDSPGNEIGRDDNSGNTGIINTGDITGDGSGHNPPGIAGEPDGFCPDPDFSPPDPDC